MRGYSMMSGGRSWLFALSRKQGCARRAPTFGRPVDERALRPVRRLLDPEIWLSTEWPVDLAALGREGGRRCVQSVAQEEPGLRDRGGALVDATGRRPVAGAAAARADAAPVGGAGGAEPLGVWMRARPTSCQCTRRWRHDRACCRAACTGTRRFWPTRASACRGGRGGGHLEAGRPLGRTARGL